MLFPKASADLDPGFGGNSQHLDAVIARLDSVLVCDTLRVTSLTFSGSASPDGAVAFNAGLALRRAKALERYVREHVGLPDSVVHISAGIDWDLLAGIVEDSDIKSRRRILDIILRHPELTYNADSILTDSRRKRLMVMNGGRTWREMDNRWFPLMRYATVTIGVRHRKPAISVESVESGISESSVISEVSEISGSAEIPDTVKNSVAVGKSRKPFYMSAHTNMLFDLLLLPNIGAEFNLGKGWSIAANWTYGWWKTDRKHRYWRAYGGYLAGRKWFGSAAGRKPLTGHHAGVYAQILTYDFEFGGKGQMGGIPGEPLWHTPSYAFGLEYGYSLPVGSRLNIDFTLGIGYLGGKYYKYYPVDGHYMWQGTARRNYFGPTNAQVSLVWLIGPGNVNSRKGGER